MPRVSTAYPVLPFLRRAGQTPLVRGSPVSNALNWLSVRIKKGDHQAEGDLRIAPTCRNPDAGGGRPATSTGAADITVCTCERLELLALAKGAATVPVCMLGTTNLSRQETCRILKKNGRRGAEAPSCRGSNTESRWPLPEASDRHRNTREPPCSSGSAVSWASKGPAARSIRENQQSLLPRPVGTATLIAVQQTHSSMSAPSSGRKPSGSEAGAIDRHVTTDTGQRTLAVADQARSGGSQPC